MDGGVLQIATPRVFAPLLPPKRYKGARGGRGSGKSRFFASLAVEEHITEKIDMVCLREVQKSLELSVKRELQETISDMNAGDYFEVQDKRILSRQGGITIFEGMQNHTSDSIRSLARFKRAWFEEAHSASQRSLDILSPTLREDDSELWFSWNPHNSTDPVEQLFCGAKPHPDSVCVTANYRDNPFFPDVLRKEMEYCRDRDADKFAHIWLGGYQQSSEARIFKNWRVEEFEIQPDWILRQGADWGFSIDPSVLVQCAIVGRTLYVTHEAYMVGCEVDFLPDLFRTVPEAERWPITADSSRPETISYMQRNGFKKMLRAVKGAKSLEEGIGFLLSYDIVVHPRCRHTIDELTLYSYKTDPLTGTVLPVPEDKDNHVIDALRYACEGARRATKPQATKPVQRTFVGGNQAWMS